MKNTRRIHQAAVLLAMVLALGALLGACGSDNPTGKTVGTVSAPVPNATPVGMNNCTSCHATETEDWKLGKHANLDNGDLNGVGNPSLAFIESQANASVCLSCHDALGDGRARLVNGYTGNVPRPVVSCESCHGGGSEHSGVGPIARTGAASSGTGTALQSSEFNTCTSTCHLTYGNDSFTLATHGVDRTMEKHAAVPGDVRKNAVSSGTPSTVYFVKKGDDFSCTVCHNAHKNSADLNKEYAESGHGETTAGPWVNRDWKDPANFYCQRCHTSTGFRNLNDSLRSGSTYSALQNDYSYLQQGNTSTLPGQNETLYCWACHTDTKGTIRNPGPVTIDYGYLNTTTKVKYSTVNYTFPDLGGSNVCVPCHAGRLIGDTIKSLPEAGSPAFSFSNASLINDHDFAGGGTVLMSAYEYAGREYTNSIIYKHDKIGTSGAPGTGSNGPCVGCHMSRTEKHLFVPVDTTTGHIMDAATGARATITGVATTVCATCHGSGEALPMSADMLEEQAALRDDASEALAAVAETKGFFWNGSAYPQRDGTYLYLGRSLAQGLATVVTNGSTTIAFAQPAVVTFQTTSLANLNITTTSSYRTEGTSTWYAIASAPTNTEITLASAYQGPSTANAAFTIWKTESVGITQGTYTVYGNGTKWGKTSAGGTGVSGSSTTGDYFRVNDDGTWYRIASAGTTTLTLTAPYSGATTTGVSYTIIQAGSRSASRAIANWLTGTDADATGNVTGKNNMGALYNLYHVADGDPGSFVHNRYYTKRILYDSIDWLDDNVMNNSTGATITALCPSTATPAWCAGAKSYLLPHGVTGGADERP